MSASRCATWATAGVAALGLLGAAGPATAALGESSASIEADRMRIAAAPRGAQAMSAVDASRVVMVETGDGTRIRQFVDGSGFVYAVSWRSRTKPRMEVLLGSYFPDYRQACVQAQRERPGVRHRIAIDRGDLVVETIAHLQSHVGLAYLRSRVPAGIDLDALR